MYSQGSWQCGYFPVAMTKLEAHKTWLVTLLSFCLVYENVLSTYYVPEPVLMQKGGIAQKYTALPGVRVSAR